MRAIVALDNLRVRRRAGKARVRAQILRVIHPFAAFWGKVNEPIAQWLKQNNRLTRNLTARDYEQAFEPRFMTASFAKVGWKVPESPPFIPKGWKGDPAKPPLEGYFISYDLKQPQPFPETGDLAKRWEFGGKTFNP